MIFLVLSSFLVGRDCH